MSLNAAYKATKKSTNNATKKEDQVEKMAAAAAIRTRRYNNYNILMIVNDNKMRVIYAWDFTNLPGCIRHLTRGS